MPKLLVLQHVAHEILGTLDPLLRGSGFRIRYVNFERQPDARPGLERYDGLVILGGPMNVDEVERFPHLAHEVDLVRRAIDARLPVLGICLGAQIIARALDARVEPNPAKEIGWYDVRPTAAGRGDPLLGHFDATEKIFQWHGDTFEIPRGAEHLAESTTCANQAFRWGDNVYGLQFHLEVDAPMIARWLEVPANRAEIESLGGVDPETIAGETVAHVRRLRELGNRVFGGFTRLFEPPARRVILSSR